MSFPPGPRFTVAFSGARPGDSVIVTLVDEPDVTVLAPPGAAAFSSPAEDRVDIAIAAGDRAGVRLELRIPRAAPYVDVVSGSRRLLLAQRASIGRHRSGARVGHHHIPHGRGVFGRRPGLCAG